MMDFIKELVSIEICDIGAGNSEVTPFLDNIINNCRTHIVGFEPNEVEFNKLIQNKEKKYFNYAIGDGTKKKFYICKAPGMSSFLKPDYKYNEMFHHFNDWGKIIKMVETQTKKLDEINIKNNFDLIKIDVQGYESEIIKYGNEKIKNALVVQIETSPIPSYKNGKTFAFVASQLENLDFNLHMFSTIETRSFKPMIIAKNSKLGLHYLYQLDCVFIKNFDEIDKLNINKLLKLIYIMFYGFNAYDFVDLLFQKLDYKYKKNYLEKYRELIKNLKINKRY